MYENQIAEKRAYATIGAAVEMPNPTVEENINQKIAYHQEQIDRLTRSKEELKPLLGMRIRDIRSAMEY